MNQNALKEAEERDRERRQGKIRGPLHGIPIALKDNIQTTDMPTTGGALAFDGYLPPYEATVVKNLRDAGAVIIAKTGMTELANWMAGPPTPMPAGYNPVIGFGMNPNDPLRNCTAPLNRNYTRFLKPDALKGARIGIPRAFYYERVTPPGLKELRGGLNAAQAKLMADAIEVLRARGAVVVDPADIPSVLDSNTTRNFLRWVGIRAR